MKLDITKTPDGKIVSVGYVTVGDVVTYESHQKAFDATVKRIFEVASIEIRKDGAPWLVAVPGSCINHTPGWKWKLDAPFSACKFITAVGKPDDTDLIIYKNCKTI